MTFFITYLMSYLVNVITSVPCFTFYGRHQAKRWSFLSMIPIKETTSFQSTQLGVISLTEGHDKRLFHKSIIILTRLIFNFGSGPPRHRNRDILVMRRRTHAKSADEDINESRKLFYISRFVFQPRGRKDPSVESPQLPILTRREETKLKHKTRIPSV